MSLHPVDRRRPAVFFTWKRFGIYVYIHYIRICVSRSVSIHRFFRHVCTSIYRHRSLMMSSDLIQVAFIYPFEVSSWIARVIRNCVSNLVFFFFYLFIHQVWKVIKSWYKYTYEETSREQLCEGRSKGNDDCYCVV